MAFCMWKRIFTDKKEAQKALNPKLSLGCDCSEHVTIQTYFSSLNVHQPVDCAKSGGATAGPDKPPAPYP